MDICLRMTPEALAERLDALNGMDAVVLDANLPQETVAFLAERLRPPLFADAVSAAKARRLLPAMPRLYAIKPNALEAEALTDLPIHDRPTAEAAARRLVEMGAKGACITLGERGVCCANRDEVRFMAGSPVQMTNATGAGDAFTAALVWAHLGGLDLFDAARAGMAAAALAVESKETVNPAMSSEALQLKMAEL
jgi:pseudouridine kinase